MNKISSQDRASLIKIASALPAGDLARKAILAGLSKTSTTSNSLTNFVSQRISALLGINGKDVGVFFMRGELVAFIPGKVITLDMFDEMVEGITEDHPLVKSEIREYLKVLHAHAPFKDFYYSDMSASSSGSPIMYEFKMKF